MRDALDGLRRALDAYRADPVNSDDQASSWQALDDLLYACDAALAETEPKPCIPEGAVLVTQEGLARALRSCVDIGPDDDSRQDFGDINGGALLRPHEAAAAILRHLRETS